MEALNQNYLDSERDKERGVNVVRMRVKNRNTAALTLPDGNLIGPGEHEITVFEDHVAAVLAQVEPEPAELDSARAQFELEIAKELAASPGKVGGLNLTPAEMRKRIKAGKDEAVKAAYAQALTETAKSPESLFADKMGRGLLPLESAEVVAGSSTLEPKAHKAVKSLQRLAGYVHGVSPSAASVDLNSPEFQRAVDAAVERVIAERTKAKAAGGGK